MSILGDIFGTDNDTKEVDNEVDKEVDELENKTDDSARLKLRKEELDIAKSRVQKGEVELGKEIIEEQKIVDVPLKHEEVIIERKSLDNEVTDSPISDEETIRIPVSEEKVDVGKHTVVTGEISAHKRIIENTEHIDETLKREEAKINRIGNPDVVDSDISRD
jgi:uncharacterized protein (TIGR02271 family)